MSWFQFGKTKRQRLETLQLTSLLSRWCQVRENLMFAFEKCVDSTLSAELRQAIRDLLTRIRGGMVPDDALALFQTYSSQEHFQDLVLALRFNFRHRGNLPAMLELLEIQQNKLEEAYNDRQISNQSDMRIAAGLLLAVPVLFIARLITTPTVRALFFGKPLGLGLVAAGCLSYAIAVFWYVQLNRLIRQ